MSSKELRRVEVLARVDSKELTLVNAAEILRISYRQAKHGSEAGSSVEAELRGNAGTVGAAAARARS